MCENTNPVRIATTILEARDTYKDHDEHEDERRLRPMIRELIRQSLAAKTEDRDTRVDEEPWLYVLTNREQLAFLAYMAVRKGITTHNGLELNNFEDEELAAAIEFLLSDYEPVIALSPIANRVRRLQLACLVDGYWDVLNYDNFEREDRLADLCHW